ncbi:hypothetical protein ACPPVQ_07510 [Diaminobutyricibacter sp. McL0618]|uniref:hypothetical protein n=1 Tax=Leifsonia sp. McL0618 TaxID=3415677 RepID=UPI003CF37E09
MSDRTTHRPAAPTRRVVAAVAHSSAQGSSSVTTPAAPAPHYAPGVSATRPDNSGCGPCPGATLEQAQSGYWGSP